MSFVNIQHSTCRNMKHYYWLVLPIIGPSTFPDLCRVFNGYQIPHLPGLRPRSSLVYWTSQSLRPCVGFQWLLVFSIAPDVLSALIGPFNRPDLGLAFNGCQILWVALTLCQSSLVLSGPSFVVDGISIIPPSRVPRSDCVLHFRVLLLESPANPETGATR